MELHIGTMYKKMYIILLIAMFGVLCNGLQVGLEYEYEYTSRLTAGLRAVGRQEASSAFKADVIMQVQTLEDVTVQMINIMVGDMNGDPPNCKDSPDQYNQNIDQNIEYSPLEENVEMLEMPFKLRIEKGKLIYLNVPDSEPYWITNMRRSIAYLFMLPTMKVVFPDTSPIFEKEPYFNEYEYSPFGECLTRFSLTPFMEELKLKESKSLSIEADIQFEYAQPAALTSKGSRKGHKGRFKTRRSSRRAKRRASRSTKGRKSHSPSRYMYTGAPSLADKMWRVTRSIDFEQCLDLVQLHSQGLQMVGTRDTPHDCGERHFSRSHDGTFILRGDAEGLRLEKAEVQGVYTVDALGTNEEHINSFAIQNINLVSVRLIEEELIIDLESEESPYVETQFRHDISPTTLIDSIEDDNQEYKQGTVAKIQEIIETLSNGHSAHLVGDLNAMSQNLKDFSSDDLHMVYDQLSDIDRILFFKLIILSGFETPYLFLFEKWTNGEVTEDVIFNFIVNMANNIKHSRTVEPAQDIILNNIENQYLRSLALMNYAHLVNRFCLNPCGYKNHRDYDCTVMDCKPLITETFIPWITERLYSEDTYLWERLMYLQTLANLHTEEVISVVLPFVTDVPMDWADDQPINLRLRIGAIYALRKDNMPANAGKQVLSLLMALFENQHEHYRVREYALLMLNHWDPPAAWWYRLAISSWQEPNQQVASLIYATITTMAKVNPEARRVEALVKPAAPRSLSNSHVSIYIKGNSEDMLRYWYDFVLSGNDDGLFPRMVKLYLRLGFLNQQFNGARLSGHFDGTDVWKFFEKMFDSFEPDKTQEIIQEMYMEILEKLEMEPHYVSDNFEAHGFLTMFRSFEAMFNINQEEDLFSPFSETSLQMFINKQLLINTGRITTVVTTEAGTDLIIDITNPTLISTQSENLEIDLGESTFKIDTTIRLDSMKETHVKSMVPWSNMALVAGLESRQEIKLPFILSGAFIMHKQLSITFSPRDMETEHILLISNIPYTVRTPMQYTPRFSSLDDYKEVISGSVDVHMWPLLPATGMGITAIWESDMQPFVNAHLNNLFSSFYSISSLSSVMKPTSRKYKFLLNVNFEEASTKSLTFTINYMASNQNADLVQDYTQMTQGFVDKYERKKRYVKTKRNLNHFNEDAEILPGMDQSNSDINKISETFSYNSENGEYMASSIYSFGLGLDFNGEEDDTRHYEMVLTWARGFQEDNYGSKIQLTFFQGPYGEEVAHTTCMNAQVTMPYILPLTTIDELMKTDIASVVKIELYSDETCQGTPIITGKGELAMSSIKKEMLVNGGSEECEPDVYDPKILDLPVYDRISITTEWNNRAAPDNIKTLWNRFTDIAYGSLFPFITTDRVNVVNDRKTFSFNAKKNGNMWQVEAEKEYESTSVEQLYIPWWLEELVAPKRATDSMYESLITGHDGRPTCIISPSQVSTFDGVRYENHLDNCWIVAAMDCQQGRYVVQVKQSGVLDMKVLWTERGYMFDITKDTVMVNGEEVDSNSVTDSYRLFPGDDFMLLQLTDLMAVKITESTFSISVVHSEKGALCGICGNMDGETVADMEGPHGCIYSDTKDFITSWTTSGEGCNAFSLRNHMKPVNEYRESCPKVQYRSAARIFDAYATGVPCYDYSYKVIEMDNYICTATQPSWSMFCDEGCESQCFKSETGCRDTQYPNNNNSMVYRCIYGEEGEDNTNTPAGSNYPLPGKPKPGCAYYTTMNAQIAPDCKQ